MGVCLCLVLVVPCLVAPLRLFALVRLACLVPGLARRVFLVRVLFAPPFRPAVCLVRPCRAACPLVCVWWPRAVWRAAPWWLRRHRLGLWLPRRAACPGFSPGVCWGVLLCPLSVLSRLSGPCCSQPSAPVPWWLSVCFPLPVPRPVLCSASPLPALLLPPRLRAVGPRVSVWWWPAVAPPLLWVAPGWCRFLCRLVPPVALVAACGCGVVVAPCPALCPWSRRPVSGGRPPCGARSKTRAG